MSQVAIRRAKKFEGVANYYYDHGDNSQGDQYQARANQYWRQGGKPQMIRALRGRENPMRRYRRRNATKRASSGMSDGTKLALVVGGLAAVAGVGYLIYQNTQSSSTAAAGGGTGGGTISSGQQSTMLGPGGSSQPLTSATSTGTTDGTNIDYSTSTATGPSASTAPPVSQTIELG